MKTIKCPLCSGSGTVVINCGTASNEKRCNGCEGRGWIDAPDDSEREEYKKKA